MYPRFLLRFTRPYTWIRQGDAPTVAEAPEADSAGIYLWTIPSTLGELVCYVGETGRDFGGRMREHLTQQLAGMYHIYEAGAYREGIRKPLWNGLWGKTKEPSGVEGFLNQLLSLAPALADFVKLIRIRLAPLDTDRRTRTRIEAAIDASLRSLPGRERLLLEDGVRYHPRRPDEEPFSVAILSDDIISGLPSVLDA